MKAFVTGGTGFIGQAVVRKLIERGWEVNALVRSQSGAAPLMALGVHPVWGDVTDSESLRDGMQGCQAVFHIAGWYKLGSRSVGQAELINVEGTRNVLGLAYSLGIPRIIYTSSVAVYGDTHGFSPDESYAPAPGVFLTEYDRTKHLAHYSAADPLIKQGAPITIVMPGAVYGPGDTSLVGQMMRAFYRGLFPIAPGPEMMLTYAHIDDIAEGHLLAYEKGRPGESYHLTGAPLTMRNAMQLWAQVSGQNPPLLWLPAALLQPMIPLVELLSSYLPLPEMISRDALAILDASYLGRSDKAQRELGWQPRPPETGFRQTFNALTQTTRPLVIIPPPPTRRQTAAMALGAALGMLAVIWVWKRKR